MLARCARCQGTFTTDRFGRQFCPHCGSELILADPNAPQPPAPPATPPEGQGFTPPPPGAPPTEPPPPAGPGWSPPPAPPPAGPGGPGGPGGFGGPRGPGGPGPGPGADLPAPFAERSTRGFFKSFFETWKLVATEPQKFFAHVRIDQYGSGVLFGVLAAWVGGTVGAALNVLASRAQLAQAREELSKIPGEAAWLGDLLAKYLDLMTGGAIIGVQAVLTPLLTLVMMFVGAGILHLVLLMLKGAARGFGATLTVVAFSYGIHLIAAVPQCGASVAGVWQLVVLVIGLAAIHRTEVWKSAVAVLAPAVLCCCCCSSGIVAIISAAVSSSRGGSSTSL